MATPPAETPGGGEGLVPGGAGVGVGNAVEAGEGPGVGVWAKAVEQTINVPSRTAPQIMDSLIDLTGGILFTPFPA